MNQVLPLVAVLLAAAAFSLLYRSRTGRVRRSGATAAGSPSLVLFTLPGCAVCPQAMQVLDEVAGPRRVPVRTVNLAEAPGHAAGSAVHRAPTTLIVGPDGAELGRVGGVPDPRELADALDGWAAAS